MKHIPLFTFAFALHLSLFASPFAPDPATEVVVYSPASTSPLHVSTIPTNTADVSTSITFPSSYTGHRSVCALPSAYEDHMLSAWIGGDTFTPGDAYGIAVLNENAISLTRESPITPRFELASGTSDRGQSFESILADAIEHNPEDRQRLTNNRIEAASVSSGQRIRIVRWLINRVPVRACGVTHVVVVDKRIETDVNRCFTEADILDGSTNAFDLDWANLYSEVADDEGVWSKLGGEVTRMCYLIVVGDGDVGWDLSTSTNVVRALPTAIVRKFGENQVKPTPLNVQTINGRATVKWIMDCPFEEGYTAFRIVVTSGGLSVFDSQKFYAMPINGQNLYSHTLNHTFDAGTYDWKIAAFNSKYSQDTSNYYTNGVPFTVTGN